MPSSATWDAAHRAAIAAARGLSPTSNAAGWYAVQTAYHSIKLVDRHHRAALDAVTGNALRAHMLATEDTRGSRIMELTRHAIRSWRQLAGLENGGDINCESSTGRWALVSQTSPRNGSGPTSPPQGRTPQPRSRCGSPSTISRPLDRSPRRSGASPTSHRGRIARAVTARRRCRYRRPRRAH